MRSCFFVPVYNQIQEFPAVLEELKKAVPACDEVLLVNNGSSDGSEELVRNSGYRFLDLPENRGIGYSFIRAIEWAMEQGFDVFGSMASNGKMLPAEMGRIIEPLRDGRVDYVTGSRFLPGGASPNLPGFRRTAIPMVGVFAYLLTGCKVTDATGGYRAFRLDLIKRANFDWRAEWLYGYSWEYYFYAKVLLDRKIKWTEVPITMRYPPAGRRYSKIKPFIGWYDMLRPWLRARIDGLGFAADGGS